MPSTKYGYDHQQDRKRWQTKINHGQVICRRYGYDCQAPNPYIQPGETWDLGHPDATCPLPLAPEHARCNRSAGAKSRYTGNRMTIREW